MKFIIFVVLTLVLSYSTLAQSYYASKMQKTAKVYHRMQKKKYKHNKLKQKLQYAKKRRQSRKQK